MRAAMALLPPSLVWNEVLRDTMSALTGENLAGGVVEMLDELMCMCPWILVRDAIMRVCLLRCDLSHKVKAEADHHKGRLPSE